MKTISALMCQVASLIMIRECHASHEKISSSRTLDHVVAQCSDEFEDFKEINTVFQEGFRGDESCEITASDHHSVFDAVEAYCNYDTASVSTTENCESSNGVLYEVHAEEICDFHLSDIIFTEYENAYLCVSKSCHVDDVLEYYKNDIESDGSCLVTFRSWEANPKNQPVADHIPTKYGACEDIETGLTTCVLSSDDCAPMEVWLSVVEGCRCSDVQIGLCTGDPSFHLDYCAISSDECDEEFSTFVPARTVSSTYSSSDCRLCYEDEMKHPDSSMSTSSEEDETSSLEILSPETSSNETLSNETLSNETSSSDTSSSDIPETSSSDTLSSPPLSSSPEDDGMSSHAVVLISAVVSFLIMAGLIVLMWNRNKRKAYVLPEVPNGDNNRRKDEEYEEQMEDVCIT